MLIVSGEKGEYFRCKYDGTTEKLGGKKGKKKMSRHEERRLLKKINQDDEPQESALAAALKKATETIIICRQIRLVFSNRQKNASLAWGVF